MIIDFNLCTDENGAVVCRHCETTIGDSRSSPMNKALRHARPSVDAGPGIHADPALFVDRGIMLRQVSCPGCFTLLRTEIVPAEEPSYREWSLR
ncbi:hypothetical protein [Sciscionella marina]|uniref:hypothetical protein n=1 Tax=Sciscionella marina TaxID=508770 RepID=UPI0003A160FB|nr:hypothetical protein [Sciscionella marina]